VQALVRVFQDFEPQFLEDPDEITKIHFDEVVGMTGKEAQAFISQDPRTLGIKEIEMIESGSVVTA